MRRSGRQSTIPQFCWCCIGRIRELGVLREGTGMVWQKCHQGRRQKSCLDDPPSQYSARRMAEGAAGMSRLRLFFREAKRPDGISNPHGDARVRGKGERGCERHRGGAEGASGCAKCCSAAKSCRVPFGRAGRTVRPCFTNGRPCFARRTRILSPERRLQIRLSEVLCADKTIERTKGNSRSTARTPVQVLHPGPRESLPDASTSIDGQLRDIVRDHYFTLSEIVDNLRAIVARYKEYLPDKEQTFLEEVAKARAVLDGGIRCLDLGSVRCAVRKIDRVLAFWPSQMNARLTENARELALGTLAKKLKKVVRPQRFLQAAIGPEGIAIRSPRTADIGPRRDL